MFIIAEIGSNWRSNAVRQDPADLVRCVHVARAVGASAVKFQLWHTPAFVNEAEDPEQATILQHFEIPHAFIPYILVSAQEAGIDLVLSVFDEPTLREVCRVVARQDWGVSLYLKVASADFVASQWVYRVIEAAQGIGASLILSTGGTEEEQIFRLLPDYLRRARGEVMVLHCIASYPAYLAEAQISIISRLVTWAEQEGWPVRVGLSDHFQDDIPTLMAVGAGATVFEKHLKPNFVRRPTPDTDVSLRERDFRAYVASLKRAELAYGIPPRRVTATERLTMLRARRGSDGKRPSDSWRAS